MKYTAFLVSCGLLALTVHGFSTSVEPDVSEEQFPVEVEQFVDTMMRARSSESEESGCNNESTESECETKNDAEVETPGAKEDQGPNNDLKDAFKRSIYKILTAIKFILVDDVPLLYKTPLKCGKRFSFKCQYTTENDTDDYFYGFRTVPGPTMLRVTDTINAFVSNSLVSVFASSIDQQLKQSPDNYANINTECILQRVQSIVERDPDQVPEEFVCGFQVGKHLECSYDKPEEIIGPELDLNDRVKRIVDSENFRSGVIKFAKEGYRYFPALKSSLTDNILSILLKINM